MSRDLRVTVLVENTVYRSGLWAEHGLSLWIEYEDHRILFDTGQTDVLIQNAQTLGIDLSSADAVVLSHGHYDHSGGLAAVLNLSSRVPVYGHSKSLARKFHVQEGMAKNVGMPSETKEKLLHLERQERLVYTDGVTDIVPGVTVTGAIPRRHTCETLPQGFYLDEAGQIPDPLEDDQAVFLDTDQGIVVVLGCTHAGVRNTLDYIECLVHDRKLYAVIGGMHLRAVDSDRLAETLTLFQHRDVQVLAPGHCTGPHVVARMHDVLSPRCVPCSTGVVIDL
jgi:7,8-dihydropterin-6-yl-methyl-4-(beta-D-ribofuranosyl)aminobenzene 5'-phosphate synthase